MTSMDTGNTKEAPAFVHLDEQRWENLIKKIRRNEVTLFLGAGACYKLLPLGQEVITKWLPNASDHLVDELATQLPHVAQYRKLCVSDEAITVKADFVEDFIHGKAEDVDFTNDDQPLSRLAQLPFDIVITTNYDDLMFRAFAARPNKTPRYAICQWNNDDDPIDKLNELECQQRLTPSEQEPFIFHLHGHHSEPKSLVLLEEDYEQFLATVLRPHQGKEALSDILPTYIQTAISQRSLLFIGYSLQDMTFRSVFRGLLNTVTKINTRHSITVQYNTRMSATQAKYAGRYFGDMKISFVNQSAEDFTKELLERWKKA